MPQASIALRRRMFTRAGVINNLHKTTNVETLSVIV